MHLPYKTTHNHTDTQTHIVRTHARRSPTANARATEGANASVHTYEDGRPVADTSLPLCYITIRKS
jgi:hypothetical protein